MRNLALLYFKSRFRMLVLKRVVLSLLVTFFLVNLFILKILLVDNEKCTTNDVGGLKKIQRYKPKIRNTSVESSCTGNTDIKLLNNNKTSLTQLTCLDQDWLIIDSTGLVLYNFPYLAEKRLAISSCQYWIISWHKNDFTYKYSQSFPIDHGQSLGTTGEFFYIQCRSTSGEKYKSLFARIFKPVEKFRVKQSNGGKSQPVNIFMLGLDSVSREAWLANLPESSEYLLNRLNASVLTRFNVVGDGTVAALTPMLTGKHEHELPDTLKTSFKSKFVDQVYPFLWSNFSSELGYASMFAEDWPSIGTFHYRLNGMSKPPTDHYMR
jgi:hypothetical protein